MAKNGFISLLSEASLFGDLGAHDVEAYAAVFIDPGKLRENARRVDG